MSNNPELATATAVSFFDPRPRPLLDDGEKDQTAARNGKPLEMQDEYPKRLYHRTGRASAMAIVEQGFLVGGGPENYFSDKPSDGSVPVAISMVEPRTEGGCPGPEDRPMC